MFERCIFITIVLCTIIRATFACNGYTLTLHKYGSCIPNGVITIPNKNSKLVLDKDCNIILTGCMEMKAFKTAKGSYVIKKSPLPPMEGDFDLCELATEIPEEVLPIFDMFGMPKKCPVQNKKICADGKKKISIAKFKNQIGMAAGNIDLKLEMTHDTGKTCLEANFSITKPRKG
ncbi:uncharacterized protein LOC109604090 [Aethina tumida]|uniref:uncharacterized protein LOC109604090 n=1 Tax=Aethina tumida TaxID=116153 RepID=UPI0021497F08|nr:uncharacterized protein LOC109604090 [Aethina tumida]